MAFRKNKKFIDPRYFMDEKTDIIKEEINAEFNENVEGADTDAARERLLDLEGSVNVLASRVQDEELRGALLDLQGELRVIVRMLG